MAVAALVVAAGSGTRAGGAIPKQFMEVGGQPLLCHSLRTFLEHPRVAEVMVVINPAHAEAYARATRELRERARLAPPVHGGNTRQQSVRNGLRALASRQTPPEVVMIHDAARPFMPARLVDTLLDALLNAPMERDGVIPALEVVDTIKRIDGGGIIIDTPPRHLLRAAQTPQTFFLESILAAHERAAGLKVECSDDAAVAEHAGLKVGVVAGDARNRKITHPEDFAWARDMAREERP